MPVVVTYKPKPVWLSLLKPARAAATSPRLARVFMPSAAILAGILTSLPWLDERTFPAAWIGMSLWIAITANEPMHRAFRLWLLGGIVVLACWFHWLPGVAAHHLEVSLLDGALVTLLAITWDALRFGIFGFLVALIRSRGRSSTFVWPTVWVALEWLWPHLFPWRIGQSQLGWLPLCQIAEFTGAYGVSFFFLWGAAVAASWLRAACVSRPTRELRKLAWQSITWGLSLIAVLAWGTWRMQQIDLADGPIVRFGLVQPGSRQDDTLRTLRQLSRNIAHDTDLVVWGETSVGDFSLELDSFESAEKVEAATASGLPDQQPCPGLKCPLLCGGCSFDSGHRPTGPFFNTAFLVAADETIIGRYHKRVLMPWGEYAVGQQCIPGLRGLLGDVDSFVAGHSAAPLVLSEDARLGVLICYEDLMPNPAREAVLDGANVLVNLNNLSAFGRTAALRQHQQLAKFRAIESRRWLVRCGTTGSTAVISATGRVQAQAPTNAPATIVATVPLIDTLTTYTRFGDVFAALCTVASLLLGANRYLALHNSAHTSRNSAPVRWAGCNL